MAIGNADQLERMSKTQRKSRQMAAADDDQAFDQWVARQLHKVYDEVLSEPVPDELLRLVERLDAPAGSSSRDDASGAADHPADAASDEIDKASKG